MLRQIKDLELPLQCFLSCVAIKIAVFYRKAFFMVILHIIKGWMMQIVSCLFWEILILFCYFWFWKPELCLYTAQKMKFLQLMWPNLQCPLDLITFTEEILNRKLHFLWSVNKRKCAYTNVQCQKVFQQIECNLLFDIIRRTPPYFGKTF